MPEWRALTAPEVAERAGAGAVALWPIGSTEQHGPHLVTGFDHLAAEAVVRRAAEELGEGVLVLPTLAVGASEHHFPLGGVLSVPPAALVGFLVEVCRSAARSGIGHVVIVNGHGGNVGPGITAAASFVEGHPVVEFVSYWDLVPAATLEGLTRADTGIGHAGEYETSIALYLGGLIRGDRVPAAGRPPYSEEGPVWSQLSVEAGSDGVFGEAAAASVELGRALVETAAARLAEHVRGIGYEGGRAG